jgi:hypothetical protein
LCQLAAYIGDRDISKTLLNCLRYQEAYFGAQATGMGTLDNGVLNWVKEPGAVDHVINNSEIMKLKGTRAKLDVSRNAPDPHLNIGVFREEVTGLLKKKALTSVEIILALSKSGGERVFDMDEAGWKELVKVGWGDQNQIIDPLEQLAEEGSVVRKLEQRMEGGNYVPRFVWSL